MNEKITSSYFDQMNQYSILTPAEERKLLIQAAEGDENAKAKLVSSNLRFVVKIAHKYKNRGLDLEDLISEGNCGLISAVAHFNPKNENRFTTYAVWWIRQAITKALCEQASAIRFPLNRPKESAECFKSIKSLDTCIDVNGEAGNTMGDMLAETKYMTPEDETVTGIQNENLKAALKELDSREQCIISMRYGLNGNKAMSLREISDKINLSRERIRQIEMACLEKLRNNKMLSCEYTNAA